MLNRIILKEANADNSFQIAAIEKECFSEPWSQNSVNEFICGNGNTILCAFYNNRLCGYVSKTQVLDEIQIANVAVSEEFRRQGIASILIETIINKSISQNVSFITLDVRKSNIAAIKLYEKHGFNPEGIRKNYYKNPSEDAIIMNRYLDKGNL